MSIRIIPLQAEEHIPLVPDILWDGRSGDYRRVGADEVANPFGLQSRQQLATAVLICLQTDRAVEPEALRDGDEQRGWAGDTFDLAAEDAEGPLGSRLWQLRRSVLDPIETPRFAEYACREALQPLIDQGAFTRIEFSSHVQIDKNRFEFTVDLFGRDGRTLHQQQFAILWDNLNGIDHPLA